MLSHPVQRLCGAYACGAESFLPPSRSHPALLVLAGPRGFGWPGCKRARRGPGEGTAASMAGGYHWSHRTCRNEL